MASPWTVLLNRETHGVGKPNRISAGLEIIRSLLTREVVSLPDLDCTSDYAPVSRVRALPTLEKNARTIRTLLQQRHLDPAIPLCNLGGDCGSELAPVAWLNEGHERRLRVVWFDAHADLNSPATSPTGAFHGMVLRTLCGDGPRELEPIVPVSLDPRRIILAGVRELDPGELKYIIQHQIQRVGVEEINTDPGCISAALPSDDPVYIHIDYDVLDGEIYPDSSYQTLSGLTLESLLQSVIAIRQSHQIAGMSLTEYAPQSDNGGRDVVQRILIEALDLPPARP